MIRRFQGEFEQTVNCNFQAIPAIIGVVVAAVGTIVQVSASQQAAQNAQAMANYNAQVQQQNAMVAYQMQVAQAQQAAAIAANNAALASQQAAIAAANQQVALQNAQILRDQAENIRAQQREEASRMREDNERRLAAIRSKYAGSGVTFEGSPLVVLADAAQLAETSVQDAHYIAELESRKALRAADVEEYRGRAEFASAAFEANVLKANYETQIQAAQYDSLIAGTKHRIALNAAELTRFEGGIQASAYRAQGTASLISGIGSAASSAVGGFSAYADSRANDPDSMFYRGAIA